MNNKTIIEFGFRITWRIMEILEGVMASTDNGEKWKGTDTQARDNSM